MYLFNSCSKTAGPTQSLWQAESLATATPSGQEWKELEVKSPFTPTMNFSCVEFQDKV